MTEQPTSMKRFGRWLTSSAADRMTYRPMMLVGNGESLELKSDGEVRHTVYKGNSKTRFHLTDITSIELANGSDLHHRLTLTRLALVGVFAFGLKKRAGGQKYLTIETDETLVAVQVPHKRIPKAQELITLVRQEQKENS